MLTGSSQNFPGAANPYTRTAGFLDTTSERIARELASLFKIGDIWLKNPVMNLPAE